MERHLGTSRHWASPTTRHPCWVSSQPILGLLWNSAPYRTASLLTLWEMVALSHIKRWISVWVVDCYDWKTTKTFRIWLTWRIASWMPRGSLFSRTVQQIRASSVLFPLTSRDSASPMTKASPACHSQRCAWSTSPILTKTIVTIKKSIDQWALWPETCCVPQSSAMMESPWVLFKP